jgi:FAD/FMN-containing dehydrogenase
MATVGGSKELRVDVDGRHHVPIFDGRLWRNGEAGFRAAVTDRLFNSRLPAAQPAAVLRAASVSDVINAVRLAAQEGWVVSVRSGGHSLPSWSMRDNSLLIDLGRWSEMSFDGETNIVTVGPAVRGGAELDPFLESFGRMFPTGHAPDVAMGGFLLQGGMGWNSGQLGWAAELIESFDAVTASGELLRCSETENPELFWAGRGAGPGFFAVVVSYRLRTVPRPCEITRSVYAYPAALTRDLLTWFCEVRGEFPHSVELALTAIGAKLPAEGTVLVSGVSFAGRSDALDALSSFDHQCKPLWSRVRERVTMKDLFREQEEANPSDHRWTADNAFLMGPVTDLVDAIAPAFASLPSEKSFAVLGDFSALAARPAPDMAASLFADLYFAAYAVGNRPHQDRSFQEWFTETMGRLTPLSEGCYIGDSDLTVRRDRVMTDASWERFKLARSIYDPETRFVGYLGIPLQ